MNEQIESQSILFLFCRYEEKQ